MLNPDDEMKAALLIREMRGWAKYEPKSGLAECLIETADLMEKFLDERRQMEQYISEREWLHREG